MSNQYILISSDLHSFSNFLLAKLLTFIDISNTYQVKNVRRNLKLRHSILVFTHIPRVSI